MANPRKRRLRKLARLEKIQVRKGQSLRAAVEEAMVDAPVEEVLAKPAKEEPKAGCKVCGESPCACEKEPEVEVKKNVEATAPEKPAAKKAAPKKTAKKPAGKKGTPKKTAKRSVSKKSDGEE